MHVTAEQQAQVTKALKENPSAVIDHLAKELDLFPAQVIACLPTEEATVVAGNLFERVMLEMSDWGKITFIVHTEDVVLEARGAIPKGSFARGYYNIHGDSPIGGHLKASNCDAIAFVSRPLFNKHSCSVQFYNKKGGCMYKVYLGRDEDRDLIPEQVEMFDTLRKKLAEEQA